jgi:hypothetical protein
MHNAPAVTYPVGRSRFAAALMGSAWLLGASTGALWWVQAPSSAWRLWLVCAVSLASGAWAAWSWWRTPAGSLEWDGEAWRCSFDASALAGRVQVSLDLQRCVLLRWSAGSASHWLWLERRQRAERWDDLRRAVYSRARMEAPREDEPSAATS